MYMLNLLFDFNDVNGQFSGEQPGGKLMQSKNWLKLTPDSTHPEPGDPFPPGFDVETAVWGEVGNIETGPLHIPKSAAPDDGNVGIRIAPESGGNVPAGMTLTLAVCFGRPTMPGLKVASPFREGGSIRTTFVFKDVAPNSPPAGTSKKGWFFPIGMIKERKLNGNKHHPRRFEYAIGAILKDSTGTERHFGQDPEMDIGPEP